MKSWWLIAMMALAASVYLAARRRPDPPTDERHETDHERRVSFVVVGPAVDSTPGLSVFEDLRYAAYLTRRRVSRRLNRLRPNPGSLLSRDTDGSLRCGGHSLRQLVSKTRWIVALVPFAATGYMPARRRPGPPTDERHETAPRRDNPFELERQCKDYTAQVMESTSSW